MVRPLSLAQHTLFADLLEQGDVDLFDPEFPENGSFIIRPSRPGTAMPSGYVYYQGYRPVTGDAERGRRYAHYIGRADDPAVAVRTAQFRQVKAVRAERATTVRALLGAGMPRPDRDTGRIIEALARSGLFPDHAVLLDRAASQTYGGVLGVRLFQVLRKANDDRISVAIAVRDRDRLGGILNALQTLEPSFAIKPNDTDSPTASIYRSGNDVQVIVSMAGSTTGGDEPRNLTDLLIENPVRSIVLHGPGIPVAVPAPERYVVHELIVYGLRKSQMPKREPGILGPVLEVVDALSAAGRQRILADVFAQVWERKPQWRTLLRDSVCDLPDATRLIFQAPRGHA